jgi:hypothetical protein
VRLGLLARLPDMVRRDLTGCAGILIAVRATEAVPRHMFSGRTTQRLPLLILKVVVRLTFLHHPNCPTLAGYNVVAKLRLKRLVLQLVELHLPNHCLDFLIRELVRAPLNWAGGSLVLHKLCLDLLD